LFPKGDTTPIPVITTRSIFIPPRY
jgi:hypothetical protein